MEITEQNFEVYLKKFKEHVSKIGYKNSVQKDYILKTLFFCTGHLSAEQVLYAIKEEYNLDIGIATIYRTMKFLEELDIVKSLDVGDSVKRYELNISVHHDHMICTSCYKIIEFADDVIENRQVEIAKKHGFTLNDHVMNIYGICENCQK